MSGAAPSYDDLLDLTRQQARLIRDLEAKLARPQAEADRLEAEPEEARRAGKRQAAPFSEGAAQGRPEATGPQARPSAQPSAGPAARTH